MAKKEVNDIESTELENLKQQVELLKSMLSMVSNKEKENIDKDRDIPFISLSLGTVNLSTEGDGKGDIFTFEHFGDNLMIPMTQAKQIIRKNKNFIREGLVYIDDEEFIKSERLTSSYKNILSKEEIESLITKKKKDFESTFNNMTKSQQELIAGLIVDKIRKDEEVDMNIIQVINTSLKTDLIREVEDFKLLLKNEQR